MTVTLAQTGDTEVRPAFLDGFARAHAAMRRDVARLPQAIVAARTAREKAALLRWYRCFRSTLEHHHEREDMLIWPELIRRDPSFAAPQNELLADHHVLDAALAAVEGALTGDGDRIAAAEQLRDVVVEHLGREEAAAFPRLAACFTAQEWESLEQSFLKNASTSHLAFEIPWALEGVSAAELAEIKAGAPMLLRVAHRLVFAPRYARVAAPMLAVTA